MKRCATSLMPWGHRNDSLGLETRIERAAKAIWPAMALLFKVPTMTWEQCRTERKKYRLMYETVRQIAATVLRAAESRSGSATR
jgi:hypothetical protein